VTPPPPDPAVETVGCYDSTSTKKADCCLWAIIRFGSFLFWNEYISVLLGTVGFEITTDIHEHRRILV